MTHVLDWVWKLSMGSLGNKFSNWVLTGASSWIVLLCTTHTKIQKDIKNLALSSYIFLDWRQMLQYITNELHNSITFSSRDLGHIWSWNALWKWNTVLNVFQIKCFKFFSFSIVLAKIFFSKSSIASQIIQSIWINICWLICSQYFSPRFTSSACYIDYLWLTWNLIARVLLMARVLS